MSLVITTFGLKFSYANNMVSFHSLNCFFHLKINLEVGCNKLIHAELTGFSSCRVHGSQIWGICRLKLVRDRVSHRFGDKQRLSGHTRKSSFQRLDGQSKYSIWTVVSV